MGFKPDDPPPVPSCPGCFKPIERGQDTAKLHGLNWHAGCAEDRLMDEREAGTLEENDA
jgi:hypothetical protein